MYKKREAPRLNSRNPNALPLGLRLWELETVNLALIEPDDLLATRLAGNSQFVYSWLSILRENNPQQNLGAMA